MIGLPLNERVAGFQDGLGFVENKRQLPFEHHAKVDGWRAMHEGLFPTRRWRKFGDAEHRAP